MVLSDFHRRTSFTNVVLLTASSALRTGPTLTVVGAAGRVVVGECGVDIAPAFSRKSSERDGKTGVGRRLSVVEEEEAEEEEEKAAAVGC